jgi:hypothetical protein
MCILLSGYVHATLVSDMHCQSSHDAHVTNMPCDNIAGVALTMEEQNDTVLVQRRVNAIQALRLGFTHQDGCTISEQILRHLVDLKSAYLVDHPSESMEHIPKIDQLTFYVGQHKVCHQCWAAAAGLLNWPEFTQRKSTLKDAITAYYGGKETMPKQHNANAGGTSGQKRRGAIGYITQFVSEEAGNSQQKTGDNHEHLQGISRKDILKQMTEWHANPETQKGGSLPPLPSISTLGRAIKDMNASTSLPSVSALPSLKFDKHRTQQECAVCSALQLLIARAQRARTGKADARERLKLLKDKYALHHTLAKLEKAGEHVREVAGRARGASLSVAWDGFDSYKSSNFRYKGKAMGDMKGIGGGAGSESAGYTFKTQGVLLHGWGYYLYILDPRISANANFNIECCHRTLIKFFAKLAQDPNAEYPSNFYIQVDGASDNKCRLLFMYGEYLIRIGMFDVVIVSFLIVGHTHNKMDQKFVPITFELRKGVVKCLDDLLGIYKKAYKEVNQEPECIEVVKSVGDYKTWLVKAVGAKRFSGFAKRVPDQHRPHQMISRRCAVTTETPHGVCFDYKNLSVDRTIWNLGQAPIVLLNGLPDEAGPVMQTPQTHAGQKGHLERLASQKEGITNLMDTAILKDVFEKKDRDYTTNLFNSFSRAGEKKGILLDWDECSFIKEMEEDYKWEALPKRSRMTAEVIPMLMFMTPCHMHML